MNAAVSLTMCAFGRLGWKMLPLYVFAQFLGSFLAAGTIYAVYYGETYVTAALASHSLNAVSICRSYIWLLWREHDSDGCEGHSWNFRHLSCAIPVLAWWIYRPGSHQTQSTRTRTPPALICLINWWRLCHQVFGTAMLLLCIMALSDQKNKPAPAGGEPIAVGLLVLLIGISLGSNSGYAINPSRDIAPRIFTAIAGWGVDVFRYARRTSCCFGSFYMTPFLPFILRICLAEKKPSLDLHTPLSESVQVWKWVVVGAYNRSLHWRIVGRGDLQDHGGNAPPSYLQEGGRAGKGGGNPPWETRKHRC